MGYTPKQIVRVLQALPRNDIKNITHDQLYEALGMIHSGHAQRQRIMNKLGK